MICNGPEPFEQLSKRAILGSFQPVVKEEISFEIVDDRHPTITIAHHEPKDQAKNRADSENFIAVFRLSFFLHSKFFSFRPKNKKSNP